MKSDRKGVRDSLISRMSATPIMLAGRLVALTKTPACWCGNAMEGDFGLFVVDGNSEIAWACPEHGNAGLEFSYFNDGSFATAVSVWEMTG